MSWQPCTPDRRIVGEHAREDRRAAAGHVAEVREDGGQPLRLAVVVDVHAVLLALARGVVVHLGINPIATLEKQRLNSVQCMKPGIKWLLKLYCKVSDNRI